jgi:serine/threonine protein phosphatase 1
VSSGKLRAWLAGRFGFAPAPLDVTPTMAEGVRLYAVGDIHGESALLDRLLTMIADDMAGRADRRAVVVFLGDYVDRGPDSRGVLDRLTAAPLSWAETRFLAGNHESALLDFIDDPVANARWLDFGGAEALASYGVRASVGVRDRGRLKELRDHLADRLPDAHRRFLEALEDWAVYGDYAFVHAGIRPGRALKRQRRDDLLWLREPFLSSSLRHEKVIVHGHTIVDAPEIRPNRIAVDTGAYATGVLTAVVLDGTERSFLKTGKE